MVHVFALWRIGSNFREYITHICHPYLEKSRMPYQISFYLLLEFFIAAHMISMMAYPQMSTRWRIIHYDTTLFLDCDSFYNLIHMSGALQTLFYLFTMYRGKYHRFGPIMLVHEVLIERRDGFFVHRKIGNRAMPVHEYIQRFIKGNIGMWHYFVQAMVFTLLFYQIRAIFFILQEPEYYFLTFSGIASLLAMEVNQCAMYIQHSLIAFISSSFTMVMLGFTMICFIQLRQANAFLNRKRVLTQQNFSKFAVYQTQTLGYIQRGNKYFGNLLLGFMAIYIPINTNLTMSIIRSSKLSMYATVEFVQVAMFQYTCIFGFHLLAAMYQSRIHACAKGLLYWSAQQANSKRVRTRLSVLTQMKMLSFTERFYTRKKFGISYGTFGLMSFGSFFKFLLVYSELLMYWGKNKKQSAAAIHG